MNAGLMEHRWGDRAPFDIAVQLIGPSRTVAAGRMKNFSISGAFIETGFDPPVMTSITLMIPGAGSDRQHPRAILGYVVRHGQGGLGMGWWNLAPTTVLRLVAIREALTQDADMPRPSEMYY